MMSLYWLPSSSRTAFIRHPAPSGSPTPSSSKVSIDTGSKVLTGLDAFRHQGSDFNTCMVREDHDITLLRTFGHLHHEHWRADFEEVPRAFSGRYWSLQRLSIWALKLYEVPRTCAVG